MIVNTHAPSSGTKPLIPLGRSDSKIAAFTCQGINLYNGQPCRNRVAASRLVRLCHKHQDQSSEALTTTNHGGLLSPIRSPVAARPKINTPTQIQTTPNVTDEPRATAVTKPRDVSHSQMSLSTRPVPDPEIPGANLKSQHRFRFSDLLRALSCIPVSVQRVSVHTENKLSCTSPSTDTKAGVSSMTETRQEIPATRQYKSVKPSSRDNDSQIVRRGMSYFVDKYAALDEYQHKTSASHRQLVNAIKDIVSSSLAQSSIAGIGNQPKEYIYVFRLDGDYTYTPTISLKIGRTSKDVDTRLRQWYLQCRHKVDRLDEFETSYAMIVEKMLHLEFKESRILKHCQCGRQHKEWFEVDRDGAKTRIRSASPQKSRPQMQY